MKKKTMPRRSRVVDCIRTAPERRFATELVRQGCPLWCRTRWQTGGEGMAYRNRLTRSLLLSASLTSLGVAAQANERSFSCIFSYQTTLRANNGQFSSTGSPTAEQILLLE